MLHAMDDERVGRFREALEEATRDCLAEMFSDHGEASCYPKGEGERTFSWRDGVCEMFVCDEDADDVTEWRLRFSVSVQLDEIEELE